jgi:ribosomal protein S27AE
MATRSLSCPRCGGGLEPGFTIDVGYGTKALPKWVAGEPIRSIWTGLKLGGHEQLEVTTYRCPRCGYLESYAAI